MNVETKNQTNVANDLRNKLEQHGYIYWGYSGVDDFYTIAPATLNKNIDMLNLRDM
jgi:hypothetical protein